MKLRATQDRGDKGEDTGEALAAEVAGEKPSGYSGIGRSQNTVSGWQRP